MFLESKRHQERFDRQFRRSEKSEQGKDDVFRGEKKETKFN